MTWKKMLLEGDGGGGPTLQGTVSADLPAITKYETVNVDVTVSGLLTSHRVFVQCQSDLENGLVCIAAYCPVNGTLRLRISNWSAAAIDGAARTWAYQAYV
ncbi:hypothetical protein ACFLV0_03215 [Chloroflexota bacterium]